LTVLDSTIFRTYFEYYTVGGAAVPGDHFGEEGIQNFSLLWGIGRLPGLTPEDPLIPNQVVTTLVDIDEDHPLDPGTQVIGSAVTIPVVTEYGINDFVYVDPALAGGYQYEVTGTNFASFIVPNALPGGDDQFSLVFGGNSYSLHAGESFNFTDYAPGGVSKFRLLSIDAGENIDPNQAPPFVSGFKFSDEGVATITQIPVLADSAVPEPSSLALLCIGAVTMVVGAVRRRRQV
jgi:hypothetical protein